MKRLDLMVASVFGVSRSQALDLIKQGQVCVNQQVIKKASYQVHEFDKIELLKKQRFVSRGGDKLFNAIKKLNIDVSHKYCLDVGAATGGFSDCLIQLGAREVVAVDVGSKQLHASLRQHPQIKVYENTNINNVNPNDFSDKFDIIVVDVSFTSLKIIFDHVVQHLKPEGEILWLFKPQFEVGKEFLNKKGIVKQEQVVQDLLKVTTTKLQAQGFTVTLIKSDLKGKQGNQEYFLHIK